MQKWINRIRRLTGHQPAMCAYSRLALRISGQTAYCLLLLGGIIQLIRPYTAHYITAMACQRAALDNIPAILLAGVIAAAIGDLAYLHRSK